MSVSPEVLAALPRRGGRVVVPWRVVRLGARIVDVDLPRAEAPRFFDIYHAGTREALARLDEAAGQVEGGGAALWRALVECPPPIRPRLRTTARDLYDLFVGLVVSGLPFPEDEQARPLREALRGLVAPLFPGSAEPLDEDLGRAPGLDAALLRALDGSLYDHELATPYLTCTTLEIALYDEAAVAAALGVPPR